VSVARRFPPLRSQGAAWPFGGLALAAFAACVPLRPPVPMAAIKDGFQPAPARCLIVFLPGRSDEARTFVEEGFLGLVREARLSADLIAANATFPYYASGTFVTRLEADVLAPARLGGYEQTWLVGASMGGFGGLFYASQHPEQVHGVLALAPWLGDRPLLEEIRDAGGLSLWHPPPAEAFTADNFQRQLWRWLKEEAVEGRPGPAIWLGWGSSDRLGPADQLLGEALPPQRVLSAPGGHNWGTWRELLRQFLAGSEVATSCAPRSGNALSGPPLSVRSEQ